METIFFLAILLTTFGGWALMAFLTLKLATRFFQRPTPWVLLFNLGLSFLLGTIQFFTFDLIGNIANGNWRFMEGVGYGAYALIMLCSFGAAMNTIGCTVSFYTQKR